MFVFVLIEHKNILQTTVPAVALSSFQCETPALFTLLSICMDSYLVGPFGEC